MTGLALMPNEGEHGIETGDFAPASFARTAALAAAFAAARDAAAAATLTAATCAADALCRDDAPMAVSDGGAIASPADTLAGVRGSNDGLSLYRADSRCDADGV